MCLVALAVLVSKFRLEPDAVFETVLADEFGKWLNPLRKFCGIPVPPIPDAIAKPAGKPTPVHAKIVEPSRRAPLHCGNQRRGGVIIFVSKPLIERRGRQKFLSIQFRGHVSTNVRSQAATTRPTSFPFPTTLERAPSASTGFELHARSPRGARQPRHACSAAQLIPTMVPSRFFRHQRRSAGRLSESPAHRESLPSIDCQAAFRERDQPLSRLRGSTELQPLLQIENGIKPESLPGKPSSVSLLECRPASPERA